MEECNVRTLVDSKEFQEKILDYVSSNELDKMISNTIFADKPECKQAVIHGMVWASLLICKCDSIVLKEKIN